MNVNIQHPSFVIVVVVIAKIALKRGPNMSIGEKKIDAIYEMLISKWSCIWGHGIQHTLCDWSCHCLCKTVQPYFSEGLGRSSHLVYCFQNLNWMKRHAPHFLYLPLLAFLPAFYFVPKIYWAKGVLYVFVIPAHYWVMSFMRNTFPAPYMLMVWVCMYNWFLEEL